MQTSQLAFVTPSGVPAWQRWLVFSPIARLAFFAAMLVAFGFMQHAALVALGLLAKADSPLHRAVVTMSMQLVPALLAYAALVHLIERRRMRELSPRDIPTCGVGGFATGAALFSIVVGVLWLLGIYHVVGTNPHANWLPTVLIAGVGAGIGEEILFRGVLFRIVEEGVGTWLALLVSMVFFGIAHANNPGATAWSSAAIAIEGGLMLGLVYHLTRSLWACIGLHAAWNIMQGTVYGIPVSGMPANGWLVSTRTGPDWLSGGGFGAEASVAALVVSLLFSLVLLRLALRRGSLVRLIPRD